MIGWLRGRVQGYQRDGALLMDVHGVGYCVNLGTSAIFRQDDEIELYVYTVVRADAIVLYGFATELDREFFELLLLTPGVGPTTALTALRTFGRDELSVAIDAGDVKALTAIPGVGAKTAGRIVLELKGKIVRDDAVTTQPPVSHAAVVEEGLKALGYSASEIRQSLEGAILSDDEAVALRQALQLMRRP